MINCQEQNSNYEVHVDTNSNVNNLDGTPGKITTLLEEIKNNTGNKEVKLSNDNDF